MAKQIKCQVCGEMVDKIDLYEDEYTNRFNKQSIKKGHKKCIIEFIENRNREIATAKYFYKLEELIIKVFHLPGLTGAMQKHFHAWNKQGYGWDVLYGAVKYSEDAMIKNRDKAWPYHYRIIENNLNRAVEAVRKWELKQKQKEFEKDDVQEKEIIIKTKLVNVDNNKSKFDIANL